MLQRMAETVTYLRHCYAAPVRIAMVLGSGLGMFAEQLPNPTVVPYREIPHFPESNVEGHAGNLVFSEIAPDVSVVCMQGRFHYYEGHPIQEVVYPIRVLNQLGATTLIITNAAGGINPAFSPGNLMLITDHLNMMGANPLMGKNLDTLGPRFPDMSEAYTQSLRQETEALAQTQGIKLVEGVYAAMSGPTYETPAEVRMLRTLGADAVGMSTVPEVIAANHMGMQVLGISCITNLAAGISSQKLSHAEVMETGERVRGDFVALLNAVLNHLAASAPAPIA
jgi:purine-nucleoside phosphorylase